MTQNNQKYYLHYDQVGSLRAVSDTTGNIIKEVSYDTFGKLLRDSNEAFKVPFGFAGGLQDKDTKLTRFGYRDYDAYTGKWTAKDPIGFSGGDSNLYGYVLGDPVNWIDEDGLSPEDTKRQQQLNNIANSIVNNKSVSKSFKSRLKQVSRQGKLRYIEDSGPPARDWDEGNYRGYSRDGNLLYMTGLLWQDDFLDYEQATRTMLHEILHKLQPGSKDHPPGFYEKVEEELNKYKSSFENEQCF